MKVTTHFRFPARSDADTFAQACRNHGIPVVARPEFGTAVVVETDDATDTLVKAADLADTVLSARVRP